MRVERRGLAEQPERPGWTGRPRRIDRSPVVVVLRELFGRPPLDVVRGEACCVRRLADLGWLALGLALGWWVYVPLHELLHAFACLATGGDVTRLEIDALYGGGVLAWLIPWVTSGSEYAGRLSGFDTHGSDLVYLATDLGPFLLTFPGVWLLRRTARLGRPALFGATLPYALAPLLSLTGDAYEIGSILVTRLSPWSDPVVQELLRGDDLILGAQVLGGTAASAGTWAGFWLAAGIGVIWAFATCALAAAVARWLGQPALEQVQPS